jgi:hypothetical protein
MTTEIPPDDWVLLEAAKRSGWDTQIEGLRRLYSKDSPFRALCDMIQQHEALTDENERLREALKRIARYEVGLQSRAAAILAATGAALWAKRKDEP